MKIKSLVYGATLVIFISATAFSTDLLANTNSSSAASPWSGVYLGGDLGAGWSTGYWSYTNPNYFNTNSEIYLGSDYSIPSNGIVGGANIGLNRQNEHFLYGVDGSILGTDFSKTLSNPFLSPLAPGVTNTYTLHFLSTADALFGYVSNRFLTYFDAGWAGGELQTSSNQAVDPTYIDASSEKWTNGWTAGVGVDYMIVPNVTLGVAYNFIQLIFNNRSVPCANCGVGVGLGTPVVNGHVNVQTVLLQMNYIFNKK